MPVGFSRVCSRPDRVMFWRFSMEADAKQVIEKWYRILRFPPAFDAEFYTALDHITVPASVTLDRYDPGSRDGKRNLLTFLYLCEQAYRKAAALNIPESVMIDTFGDIVIWTENHTVRTGGLYLGELNWLSLHLRLKLFRLGRLQFCMGHAFRDIPEIGVSEGDPLLEIHIPRGGKLTDVSCRASIDQAKEFFPRFFPDFQYKGMTCWSWLLDDTLRNYLPETSNIIRFGDLFTKVYSIEKNALIKYVFRPGTTMENLGGAECVSAFSCRIRNALLSGEQFHETLGILK